MDFPITPDRMIFPDGRIMDIEELGTFAKTKPRNYAQQRDRLEATEYWSLVDSTAYSQERWGLCSFIDNNDMEQAGIKYGAVAA